MAPCQECQENVVFSIAEQPVSLRFDKFTLASTAHERNTLATLVMYKNNVAAKHGSSKSLATNKLWLRELLIKSTYVLWDMYKLSIVISGKWLHFNQLPPSDDASSYNDSELKDQLTAEHYESLALGYEGKTPQTSSSQYVKKHSAALDHKSIVVAIPETCVKLDVPEGAFPKGKTVNISLSVHWGRGEQPPLETNQFIIGPSICCEPDGITFCKPVTLTLPHSARNITSRNITVWTKTSQGK